MDTIVVFKIDDQPLALPVTQVQRVIWAVDITAMPGQTESMMGMINVEGTIIPVINIRHLLGLPLRELDLDDHIVIVEVNGRSFAFTVDRVEGVLHYEESELSMLDAQNGTYAAGILKMESGLTVVLASDRLLAEVAVHKDGKSMASPVH